VDEAAVLAVSHLAVRDPALPAELSLAHSQVFGQLGDGGGGAMPQLVQSVPDHCCGVVITTRVHNLAEQGIVLTMSLAAAGFRVTAEHLPI
jgi:hypothetical protein